MGFLDDVMQAETFVWLDSDLFTEQVTFLPASGSSRTIKAVVDRRPPQRIDSKGNVYVANVEITVANSTPDGIVISEVDNGRARVTLARRLGTTAQQTLSIHGEPVEQDKGLLTLALR